jgi:glycosyltransferase involved in cell wall biosynthesis
MDQEMKILMLLQGDFPPDIRVEKEAACLSRRHEIHLLANNRNMKTSPEHERLGPVHVYRMNPENRAVKNMAFFMNPYWMRRAFSIVRKKKMDRMHVHDLPLAYIGIVCKTLFGLPVVIDLHENYPEALRIWGKKGKFSILARNPFLAGIYERISLKLSDHIIVVDENHKSLLMGKMGLPSKKISVVANSVELKSFMSLPRDREILQRYGHKYGILYAGNFGVERGLDVAVRAIPRLLKQIPNIHLMLIGDGPNRGDLQALVSRLGIRDHVEFTGWTGFHLMPSYMRASRICIIPQPGNALIDNGIPHKMFQYMAMRRPILAADSKAISRVIGETGCGETFVSGSSDSFEEGILKIKTSRKKYGKNGFEAVKKKYNWEKTAETLLKIYE